jgi:WD40 repeat protein
MLMIGSLVVAAAAAGAWWWLRYPDHWACRTADVASGCRHQTVLDLSTLQPGPWSIGTFGFDVSPDGELVAVGLDEPLDTDGFGLGLFDVRTGELRLIVEEAADEGDGAPSWVEQVEFSPDGTLLVAVLNHGPVSELALFDTRDGRRVATPKEHSTYCYGRVGLSADNQLIQCASSVIDLDGDLIERLESENRYAESGMGNWAWSSTGLAANGGHSELTIDRVSVDGNGDEVRSEVVTFEPRSIRVPDPWFDKLSFSPDGTVLARLHAARGSWRMWQLDGPRSDHPASQLELYDTTTGELLMEVLAGSANSLLTWTDDEELLVLDEAGPLTVFDWHDAVGR